MNQMEFKSSQASPMRSTALNWLWNKGKQFLNPMRYIKIVSRARTKPHLLLLRRQVALAVNELVREVEDWRRDYNVQKAPGGRDREGSSTRASL